MPEIDTDLEPLGLDALPARLAALLRMATDGVERQAADPKTSPEALARSVGVLARSGAALAACVERIGRLRAWRSAGKLDATEEADMDDAEHDGAHGAPTPFDEERFERGLRNLARNLAIPGGDDGGGAGDDAAPEGGALGDLVDAGHERPVAA